MNEDQLIASLMQQLLSQNTAEFIKVHNKLDQMEDRFEAEFYRIEQRVEGLDRDVTFGKRVLKAFLAGVAAAIPLLIWLWP